MSRGSYDTRAPSASSQIITLERLLEEAEERNAELQAENKRLRQVLTDNWCYEKSELAALIGEE